MNTYEIESFYRRSSEAERDAFEEMLVNGVRRLLLDCRSDIASNHLCLETLRRGDPDKNIEFGDGATIADFQKSISDEITKVERARFDLMEILLILHKRDAMCLDIVLKEIACTINFKERLKKPGKA